eukprot:341082-Chlamydomonas_euryale.AAC.2
MPPAATAAPGAGLARQATAAAAPGFNKAFPQATTAGSFAPEACDGAFGETKGRGERSPGEAEGKPRCLQLHGECSRALLPCGRGRRRRVCTLRKGMGWGAEAEMPSACRAVSSAPQARRGVSSAPEARRGVSSAPEARRGVCALEHARPSDATAGPAACDAAKPTPAPCASLLWRAVTLADFRRSHACMHACAHAWCSCGRLP